MNYEPDAAETLAAHAEARGVSAAEAFLDMAIESDARGLWHLSLIHI